MNKKLFVVFTDEKYSEVCRVLLDSLEAFSTAEVLVVALNFDFYHAHPRLKVHRFDGEFNGLLQLSFKRLEWLKTLTGPFILLDADHVANWNVDQLFDLQNCGHLILQQPGICGGIDPKAAAVLMPHPGFVYCNMVPMICSYGASEYLTQIWPTIERIRSLHEEIHDGHIIDDEVTLNWLRCLSLEKAHITISGPDRMFFDSYLKGWVEILSGQYLNRHVTWHLFHGQKDAALARVMFEKIRSLGPDFLFQDASRNRKPKIFDS